MEKEKIIKAGADFVGGAAGTAAGAAIGSVVAGPMGTIIGGAFGNTIQNVFSKLSGDIASRALSNQERKRVDKLMELTMQQIQENKYKGLRLRESRFFDADEQGNSTASQLLEGTLLAAQREYEEKKIPFIANMYANICFRDDISDEVAFSLLKLAERLSYRQLAIMYCITICHQNAYIHKKPKYETIQGLDDVSIATDTYDLYRMGIVFPTDGHVILDIGAINPSTLKVHGVGAFLYMTMELEKIGHNDIVKKTMHFFSNTELV